MLAEYDDLLDGKHGTKMCPELNTRALVRLGLIRDGSMQKLGCATIYPKDYFNPYESATGRLNKTANTVSIHWYMGSCLSIRSRLMSRITKPFHRIFGIDCFKRLKR